MSQYHHQPGRNTAQRNRDRARIKAQRPNCHICGQPIDWDLKWPDPMCFVVDHVQALARGGEDTLENKRAAHNTCNSRKRAREYAPIIRRSNSLS